jgi:hypothetical protein
MTTSRQAFPVEVGPARRDRRADQRRVVHAKVSVITDGLAHACRMVDLSRSGMAVDLAPSVAARDPRFVDEYDLELPFAKPIRITGRTVWRRGAQQAVHFEGLPEADHEQIARFLRRLPPCADEVERIERAEARRSS